MLSSQTDAEGPLGVQQNLAVDIGRLVDCDGAMIFSITTLSIVALSITTLSIVALDTECFMLNVSNKPFLLNVTNKPFMLSVIMLKVVMLSVTSKLQMLNN